MAQETTELRKAALLKGLAPFIDEVRLVDVVFLIGYIQNDKHANISDLLRSSAELIFRPGTLYYANCAIVEMDWDKLPVLFVDLIFRNAGVSVYLELQVGAQHAGVEMHSIEFENPASNPGENTKALVEALQSAKLLSPSPARPRD